MNRRRKRRRRRGGEEKEAQRSSALHTCLQNSYKRGTHSGPWACGPWEAASTERAKLVVQLQEVALHLRHPGLALHAGLFSLQGECALAQKTWKAKE